MLSVLVGVPVFARRTVHVQSPVCHCVIPEERHMDRLATLDWIIPGVYENVVTARGQWGGSSAVHFLLFSRSRRIPCDKW